MPKHVWEQLGEREPTLQTTKVTLRGANGQDLGAMGESKASGFLGKSKFSSQQWLHVNLGRKHTFECRQTILPSLVTDSLWTVKFDAAGKVLKRHEHDDVDHRDPKRVRFTHKQPDKRADMELTDDTVAKRAKLFDTSSSLHEAI